MGKSKPVQKAYENLDFLNSSDARILRILSEFLEPKTKFRKHKIVDTIVFFGSARLMSKRNATAALNKFKTINPKDTSNEQLAVALEDSPAYGEDVEIL